MCKDITLDVLVVLVHGEIIYIAEAVSIPFYKVKLFSELLADVACIVLCDGVRPDDEMMKKAGQQDIAVLCSRLPAFETAKMIFDAI